MAIRRCGKSCYRVFCALVALAPAIGGGCQGNVAGSRGVGVVMAAEAKELPAANRESPVETGPLAITWEELDLGMEQDSVFEPWMMTTQVKALEGKQVRITGYISGAIFQKENIREFPLMREKECPFGPGGQAHHVIEVELQGNLRTAFTTEPVTVEGTFSVQPRMGPNGKTWSLYRLEAARIEG